MRAILVGQVDEKRRLRWLPILCAACVAGAISALAACGGYLLLTGEFSPPVLAMGLCSGFLVIGSGVFQATRLPIGQLPVLDR